jgi:UPF0755 protein
MEKQIQNDTVEPADDPAPAATATPGEATSATPPAKPVAPKKPARGAPARQGAVQSTPSPPVDQQ